MLLCVWSMHSSLYRLAVMNSCTHKSKGSPLKIAFYPPRPLLFAYFYTSWWAILWCASFYGTLPFILGCSEAYNLSRYPQWDRLNSQAAEQANSCLRYIKASLSYMNQKNFMHHCKFFLWYRNFMHRKQLPPWTLL